MLKRDIVSAVLIDSDDDEIDFTNIIMKETNKKIIEKIETKEIQIKETKESEDTKDTKEKTKRKKTIKPSITLNTCFNENLEIIEIGIDEVGRGPLFGRVYASAVILPKSDEFRHCDMKDSKKFSSKKKIEATAEYIKQNALAWSIRYEDENTIDRINILQATQSAMHNCITDILHQLKQKNSQLDLRNILLLIDGNYFKQFTHFNPITDKFETILYHTIEQGDNKFTSIAAASILAKVERDKYIDDLCEENPELKEKYRIDTNKGYGSKHHLDGIKQHGITQWHRKTFGICKNYF